MKLEALTLDQCQTVRIWRNDCLETLRTPYPLTEEQQEAFYRDVVCNRNSQHRYFAIVDDSYVVSKEDSTVKEYYFFGMGGITNIQWENRIGEISLILHQEQRGQGIGIKAVDLLLDQAFNYLNLHTVFGECYRCNPAWEFWQKVTGKYCGFAKTGYLDLPNRKYWQGEYYDSLCFSIDKEDFNNHGST
ncbi:hypothetical protein LCGC14_0730400 [marine sediment metagenome]|uniref:N-acetyltransferase domain-containing protein n=1 Tax=marine sediment metagenome TaxID=412755 RepID=A0A0F9QUR7_9ZZZZ